MEERSHARLLREIAGGATGGLEGSALARFEGRHRATSSGNSLRAAVLGANDGLLSNFSLVMGVAGAALSGRAILIAGLAGLLAGAGSMAMGEWISVQSSRELSGRQIAIERRELAEVPEEEEEDLALIYQAKGLGEDQARELAARLMADQAAALDTLSREELGIDPEELGGSAWQAATVSFVLFALGAIVPVAPFLLLGGRALVLPRPRPPPAPPRPPRRATQRDGGRGYARGGRYCCARGGSGRRPGLRSGHPGARRWHSPRRDRDR